MKTQTWVVAIALALLAGCASQTSNNSSNTTATAGGTTASGTTLVDTNGDGIPDAPAGTGTDPSVTGYAGSTATLVLNGSALDQMFYNSVPQNPSNPRITIDMSSLTQSVIVSYVENGTLHEATFGSQHPTNSSVSDTSLNGWYSQSGTNVYKAFLQDAYGAVVLVLDKSVAQNDGTATSILGGSLWFQNFQQSNYQNPVQGPLKMCWQITAGPYDCRSFLVNNNIVMTSSLYPNNRGPDKTMNYQKLGDFGGIDRTSAGL